jgi:hypothetical protein
MTKGKTSGTTTKCKDNELAKLADIKGSYKKLSLSKLSINMVRSGRVERVYIKGQEVPLKYSWKELCLFLLGVVYSMHKKDFMRTLIKNGVLSGGFQVTAMLEESLKGIDDTEHVDICRLPDTQFYVIMKENSEDIVEALFGMVKALGLKKSDVKFDVVSKGQDDKERIKLKSANVLVGIKELGLEETIKALDFVLKVDRIKIDDKEYDVGGFLDCGIAFIRWFIEKFGDELLSKLMMCNDKNFGLVDRDSIEAIEIINIYKNKYYVYYNNSVESVLNFIINACERFNIDKDLIKFEVEILDIS